jgi:1-deoxyxylulose-5-phosphate synthase
LSLQVLPVRISEIVGAINVSQLESAANAVPVKLTPEEIAYLEEPYVPHAIVGRQ